MSPGRNGGDRRGVPMCAPPPHNPPPQELLKLQWSLGIIGGKPRHSLYFIGFQGMGRGGAEGGGAHRPISVTTVSCPPPRRQLPALHGPPLLPALRGHHRRLLPPGGGCGGGGGQHTHTQPFFGGVGGPGGAVMLIPPPPPQSFHCSSPRKMPFSKMDPSCALGFYARRGRDLELLCAELRRVSPCRKRGGATRQPPHHHNIPPITVTTPPSPQPPHHHSPPYYKVGS